MSATAGMQAAGLIKLFRAELRTIVSSVKSDDDVRVRGDCEPS